MNFLTTANLIRTVTEFLNDLQEYFRDAVSFKWRLGSKFGFRTHSNPHKLDSRAFSFVKTCMKKSWDSAFLNVGLTE